MSQIPVVSISAQGIEKNPGFKYTLPMLKNALQAIVYGDLFMRVLYATRPYEKVQVLPMRSMRNGRISVWIP